MNRPEDFDEHPRKDDLRIVTITAGHAHVYLGARPLGDVQRDYVSEEVRPGVVRDRHGWAAIPESMVAVADPVRNAGACVYRTRREAAEALL